MNRQPSQVIDSVSTKDLMKALTTLQQLSKRQQQTEVSFCGFDRTENPKGINYETYMAGQNTPNKYNKTNSRKLITPLKQKNQENSQLKVSNMKSRSHSPFDKRSERADSRTTKYSIITTNYSQKQNSKKQEMNRKNSQYPSYQSKKILEQMHKSGVNYVPIHQRAQNLLKQKQAKLAQLQKEKELSKMIQEKECTFRPNIIKNYKKPTHNQKEDRSQRFTQAQMNKFEECFIDEDFICAPTQPFMRESSINQEQQIIKRKKVEVNQHDETKVVRKKYRNEKFNSLLDLIH